MFPHHVFASCWISMKFSCLLEGLVSSGKEPKQVDGVNHFGVDIRVLTKNIYLDSLTKFVRKHQTLNIDKIAIKISFQIWIFCHYFIQQSLEFVNSLLILTDSEHYWIDAVHGLTHLWSGRALMSELSRKLATLETSVIFSCKQMLFDKLICFRSGAVSKMLGPTFVC